MLIILLKTCWSVALHLYLGAVRTIQPQPHPAQAGRDGPRRKFAAYAGELGSTKGVPRQHLLQNYGNLHKMF